MVLIFFFFKKKTAYEMRISDWSSDVCSSDLGDHGLVARSDDALRRARTQQPGCLCARELHAYRRAVERSGPQIFRPRRARVGPAALRSEERRVGKECVSTCKSRWSPSLSKKRTSTPHIKNNKTTLTRH